MRQWFSALRRSPRASARDGKLRVQVPLRDGRMLLVQPFHPDHAARIAGWLTNDLDAFWTAPRTRPPIMPEHVRDWAAHATHALVALASDHVCVYGELNNFAFVDHESWIGHLVVDPRARGVGVGQAFCQALAKIATERLRRKTVSLVVFPDNVNAVRCYRRAGFVESGSERKRFEGRPGEHELIRMVWQGRRR